MNAMKKRLLILAMTFCMGFTGCSSLGDFITVDPARYTEASHDALSPDALHTVHNDSKSFHVFNSNPYTLSLDVEHTEQDSLQSPIYGDGGVSLNAYAACLTLKVMF
ncbi:MAG: hypothetical protein QNI89_02100 [Desulfobacterales bacterium]|nr:hypothetical protein [Desulfobacterales bacterium]